MRNSVACRSKFLGLIVLAALALGGCSSTANNTVAGKPGTDTLSQDIGVTPDVPVNPDTAAPDTLSAPDATPDVPAVKPDVVVTPDVAVVDASPDVIAPADVKTTDSTTPGDVAAKPTKCTADSDCKGSFGSCLTVG